MRETARIASLDESGVVMIMKKQLGVFDGILFFVPITLIFLYIAGTFGGTGILPLDWRISNGILWGSILLFIVGAYNISGKLTKPPPQVKEYDGTISRALTLEGISREFLVSGPPAESVKHAVERSWPFDNRDSSSQWHVENRLGNDVTDASLESVEGVLRIVFTLE